MSLTGGHLDALVAAGATVEQIVALVKADMAEREALLAEKRAKDAERQRRHRESRDVTVTDSDSRDTPSPLSPPKKDPEPQKITPPISPNPEARARPGLLKGIGLPEGLPAEPWMAFVRMRKAIPKVPFTEDAARGAVRKVERLAAEGYDPAKLLWKAVDQGWRSPFPHDDCKATRITGQRDAAWHEDRAQFYERIGKPDDAREHRRKAASLGAIVRDITQGVSAHG